MSWPPIRAELAGIEPYGAPQLDVPVQLNVNENPYRPSAETVADIAASVGEAARTLNRYPDREFVALREGLAAYLSSDVEAQIAPEQVWAANGSNEVMLQLLQAFGGPGRTAISFAPTYSMYPEYARDTNTEWVVGHRESDFAIDLEKARALVEETRPHVVLLPSPNNPTGTALPPEAVTVLCEAVGDGGIVVVDEAYGEFRRTGVPSALELLDRHRNLVVTRTMSKAFAGAGLRLGYLAADPAICDAIRVVRLPYHLSAVTQAAASAALRHAPELLGYVADLREERDMLVEWLREQRARGRRLGRQLRPLRPLRRPARGLAGAARPRRADPRDRARRMAAGLGRDARRDDRFQASFDRCERSTRMTRTDRTARIERETSESKVVVEVNLDGTGRVDVSTGVGFYDHMLTAFGRHSLVDLTVHSEGDVHIDAHHTVEDTAIVLGQALRQALGDKKGIRRYGDATVPLDEALVRCVVDVSGRPYSVHTGEPEGQQYVLLGGSGVPYLGSLTQHIFDSIAHHAHLTMHVNVLAGREPHHIVETQFKAFARAFRDAIAYDPRETGIPSTKGAL